MVRFKLKSVFLWERHEMFLTAFEEGAKNSRRLNWGYQTHHHKSKQSRIKYVREIILVSMRYEAKVSGGFWFETKLAFKNKFNLSVEKRTFPGWNHVFYNERYSLLLHTMFIKCWKCIQNASLSFAHSTKISAVVTRIAEFLSQMSRNEVDKNADDTWILRCG